ncbi:MAG: hypothetical protein JWO11_3213 [Nocardioides sp.]|nr:hypothetical protein [Nocardioides sp.]
MVWPRCRRSVYAFKTWIAWVRGVEGPPDEGQSTRSRRMESFTRRTATLVFEPRIRIYRLRLHNGPAVGWSVLAFQAEQALALLGFSDENGRLSSPLIGIRSDPFRDDVDHELRGVRTAKADRRAFGLRNDRICLLCR